MKDKIQNIFISLLIILAIYQTFNLWLLSIPTTNSIANFSSVFNLSKKIDYENKENYFIPSKIITNNNKKYYLKYSELKNDVKLSIVKDILKLSDTFSNSTFTPYILDEDFIALHFNVLLSSKTLDEVFDKNYKNLNNFNFNTIHLTNDSENFILSLINTDTKEIYTSTVKNNELLDSYLTQIAISNDELYYNLIVEDNMDNKDISFVPTWDNNMLSYNDVTLHNPYLSTVGILKNDLTDKVQPLFNNAKNKVASTVDNNIVIISDAYNVAKYYPFDVLEYSYYKNPTSSNSTVYEDFIVAYEYILNDENFNNDFYLSGYSIEDGKSTFYFDCVANNLPILLTNEYKDNLGINSSIEISVSGNSVTYYKILVYNYIVSNNKSSYSRNKLVNDLINMTYDKLSMGYYLEVDNTLILYWLLSSENNTFMKSLK